MNLDWKIVVNILYIEHHHVFKSEIKIRTVTEIATDNFWTFKGSTDRPSDRQVMLVTL